MCYHLIPIFAITFVFHLCKKDCFTSIFIKVIQIIESNLTPITQYRKDKHIEKVTELEPENSELESYAISESSWFEEDSDDDNEFDFSFDELEIFDEF